MGYRSLQSLQSFYTSFPSFKKQDLSTNALANDRREDYRKYLVEVSRGVRQSLD